MPIEEPEEQGVFIPQGQRIDPTILKMIESKLNMENMKRERSR